MFDSNNTSNETYEGWKQLKQIEPYDILKVIFGSLSIILNGLLLLAMLKERKKFSAYPMSYLVANLALADFSTGLILVFVIQPIELSGSKKQTIIDLELPLIWTAIVLSFLTLFLMSLQRLVVVIMPMTWSNILTNRRTVFSIILTWSISITGGVLMRFHRYHVQFAMTVVMEVCAVAFIGIHLYIITFLRVCQQLRRRRSSELSESNAWTSTETTSNLTPPQHNKITTVVAILMIVLIVTFVPHLVCLQLFTANAVIDDSIADNINLVIYIPALEYTDALSYLNFVVNPIVYAWRLTMYRKALAGLFNSIFIRFFTRSRSSYSNDGLST